MSGHGVRRPRGLFRTLIDPSPARLLVLAVSFALALYAGSRLLSEGALEIALWFGGAAVVHDLVLLPAYTLANRGLQALGGRRSADQPAASWTNFVRVPAFLSGLLLLVWFPLILRQVDRYETTTGLAGDVYLERWLLVTAALAAASALWFAATRWYRRARR
ncbi:hypothetical protein F4561_004205 [Lipingzhangella halophila]|uniref:Uncharacterized protein n=1 Tax=Lipingzhangella halophila TaxID=1783352 RepID=A0A7W7RK10_9ACTN|nr:hypothetical protein [Lipingzhangella halophila]MBB4933385.1 hypothetical protein [Lipingzhangella halophila]